MNTFRDIFSLRDRNINIECGESILGLIVASLEERQESSDIEGRSTETVGAWMENTRQVQLALHIC